VFLARVAAEALQQPPLVVFDEFTSVVDRTVAQIGSAALARTVRRRPGLQFVAVTCHEDVEPWLTPDRPLAVAVPDPSRPSSDR
jgi:ABC-type ATPase with predicted acetyltransferase domain